MNAYERQVLDRVVERAVDGLVPLTALGFSDADRSADWAARLATAVTDDARRLGLSRPRYSRSAVRALRAWGLLAAVGFSAGAGHYIARRMETPFLALALFLFAAIVFWNLASGVRGERDTAAGRAAAGRWLGVRDWLANHDSFADLPPSAVAAWDRYLAYGAALGVTRTASAVLDLGMADRSRLWSSYGGRWRQINVTYPSGKPRYGQSLGWIAFRAVLAGMLGWAFSLSMDLGHLVGADPVSRSLALVGLVLCGYAGYLGLRVLVDLFAPQTASGRVLWHQIWQSRVDEDSSGTNANRPINFHLVLDDGQSDHTRAWILPAEIGDRCQLGDVVTIRVRPWTRRVIRVTLRQRASDAQRSASAG
ncbi:DUF2207 family protein [Micromonospora sp. NPDC050397]|uniref:DUF2207 family protein n=1 Tax=Micromonospora sp. NPDC050397 TaxID=3364279 RepID=UPI0038504D7F